MDDYNKHKATTIFAVVVVIIGCLVFIALALAAQKIRGRGVTGIARR